MSEPIDGLLSTPFRYRTVARNTISVVSETFHVSQHILRMWEKRFPSIKPDIGIDGRRYYRPEDIEVIRGISALRYGQGLSMEEVVQVLK